MSDVMIDFETSKALKLELENIFNVQGEVTFLSRFEGGENNKVVIFFKVPKSGQLWQRAPFIEQMKRTQKKKRMYDSIHIFVYYDSNIPSSVSKRIEDPLVDKDFQVTCNRIYCYNLG